MDEVEKAVELFFNGLSCTQAVLTAFCEQYGLDPDMAVRLTRAFGSGMGMGNVCGAVTGAFLVLGLTVEKGSDEREARYETYDLVRALTDKFKERHKSIQCRDLLNGVDLGDEAGRRQAIENNLFTTICPRYVRSGAEILKETIASLPDA